MHNIVKRLILVTFGLSVFRFYIFVFVFCFVLFLVSFWGVQITSAFRPSKTGNPTVMTASCHILFVFSTVPVSVILLCTRRSDAALVYIANHDDAFLYSLTSYTNGHQ